MTDARADKGDLLDFLTEIKRSYETVVFVYEQDNPTAAIVLAHRTTRLLNSLIGKLKSQGEEAAAYIKVVLRNKMSDLPDINTQLESMNKEAMKGPLVTENRRVKDVLDRLGTTVGIIEKEVRHIYGHSRDWERDTKKTALVAGGVLAALLLYYGSINAYRAVAYRGHGLKAEYFTDTQFGPLFTTRIDKSIDFDWGENPPFQNFKNSQYSVRWSGFLNIRKDDEYEFSTLSDDGVRLLIDDHPLIENWSTHFTATDRAHANLTRGLHKIVVEYFQQDGDAVIKLFWKRSNGFRKTIISPRSLFPEDKTTRAS